ncbi:LOW QUALITY PROTEIN: membrane protein, partial [Streptomyces griseoflavus Tu4000]
MDIDAWLWWLIGAAVLGIGLVITAMPELGMLAVGAVAAALVSGIFGGGAVAQVAVFAVVSTALIAVVRPIANRHRTGRAPTRHRGGRPEGQTRRRAGTRRRLRRPDQAGRRSLVGPRPRRRPRLRSRPGSGRRGHRGSHSDHHV